MDVAPLRTERLDHDVDLVALGARTGLLWVRDRAGLAGAGRHTTLPLRPASEESRHSVRDGLAALVGDDAVGLPGCGAAGFSALPFDPDGEGEVVVAEVTVGRSEDGVRFITFPADRTAAEAWDLVQERFAGPRPADQPSSYELRTPMTAATWCERLEAVRDRIAAGELDKVVLAREAVIVTDVPIDPARVLTHLAATFPSANLFLVDGFCGASPELLVSRRGDLVRSHPLAGTAPRSSDPAVDARLAARLLASDKDRWEHQITIDAALDLLLPFCSYADAEPEPTVVRLANVQHLGTLVEGRLSAPPASVLDLVAALHPTPAVGGAPRDDALKVIAEAEGVDRGRYAGPTGWVDARGNGSFAVSVRSAQLDGSTARLFAGVGVVADSDPLAELEETRTKFSALLGALIRP